MGLESIGETLRAAREAQGHSIQDASAATRVRAAYLEALERDEFDGLGSPVYVKGFLRAYASFLGLDPGPIVDAYRERSGRQEEPPVFQGGLRPIEAGFGGFGTRRRPRPNWWVLGSVAAGIVVIAGVVSLFGGDRQPAPAPVVGAPATTAPAVATPAPGTTTTSTTRPAPQGVRVVLHYVGPSWSLVRADGEQVFQGIPGAGERRTFRAAKRLELTLGDAGVVELSVNGRDLGQLGGPGEVWRGTFTPRGRLREG
ncbi:MAG TPA: RodZ domain-containing protein [Actinomycetes bacterium]|nr:RodZ domain-containing protein [Actinomycetes bacterium]